VLGLVNFFKSIGGWIAKAVGAVGNLLTGKGKDVILGFIRGYTSVIGSVAGFLRGLGGRVVGWVGAAAGWLVRKGYDLVVGFIRGYTGAIVGVATWARGLGGQVVRWVGSMASRLYSAGADLVRGFINGIGSMVGALANKASSMAGSAIDAAKRRLGIHSPSREFAKLGRFVGQGLIDGIDSQTSLASKASGRLADAVMGGFGDVSLSPSVALAGVGTGGGLSAAAPVQINVYALQDGPEVGRRVVSAVKQYERDNGKGWRS
jgi:phage-related protein